MKHAIGFSPFFLVIFITSGAQSIPNYTPTQVWENVKWMQSVKVSGAITDGPENQYTLESTVAVPGVVYLRDGRTISGNMQYQYLGNKSGTDVTAKCIMIIEGKRRVFGAGDVSYFHMAFKPADLKGEVSRWLRPKLATTSSVAEWKQKNAEYPAELFGSGTIMFNDGQTKTGVFAANRDEPQSGISTYELVYFADNETSTMFVYPAASVIGGVKSVKGKTYHFQSLFNRFIEVEAWAAAIKSGKTDGTMDPTKGSIVLETDESFTGTVALGKGKTPDLVYFVNTDDSLVRYYDLKSNPQAETVTTTIGGKEMQYTFSENGYYSMEETAKQFEKTTKKKGIDESNTLVDGTITLTNKTELKGKVAVQTRARAIFFKDGANPLRIYAKSQIKFFTQNLLTGPVRYAVVFKLETTVVGGTQYVKKGYDIVNFTSKAAAITNTGFVTIGGSQINGKVQIEGNEVWCVQENGELNIWRAEEVSTVQINEPSGKRVFYGAAPKFNELFFPFEAVSYYKNPYPVHCNWKASNTLNDIGGFIADVAAGTAALAVGTAPENANKSIKEIQAEQQKIYEWRLNAVDPKVCSVPYEEYVLVFNATKEKMIVYKENINSVVTSLVLGCENLERINRQIRTHNSMNDIPEMVKFVNTAGCVSKSFEILEPTPLAAYKWKSGLLSFADYDEEGKKGVKKAWTNWYKGWIQTLGGNKAEGVIGLVGNKTIENREMTKTVTKGAKTITRTSSSILNRKATFEYEAVVFRKKEERKGRDLSYEFVLNRDVIRSVGIEKPEGSGDVQYEEYKDAAAYEPSKETFLVQEVKIFTPNGSFTNAKGETLSGRITLEVPPNLWFATGATFEDDEGNKIDLNPRSQIREMKVNDKAYVPFREVFVEVMIDGPKHRYFRNPYPSKSTGMSNVTNVLSYAGQSAKDQGANATEADKLVDAKNVEVYRKEYVFQNRESGDDIIVYSGNDKRMLKSYLGLCDYFNGLDKKVKNDYLSIENPKRVMEMLDKCY